MLLHHLLHHLLLLHRVHHVFYLRRGSTRTKVINTDATFFAYSCMANGISTVKEISPARDPKQ